MTLGTITTSVAALGVLCLAACATTGGTAPTKPARFEMIMPKGEEGLSEHFRFAPATRAGDFIFLSGVTARLPEGAAATDENYSAAIRGAFERIENTLRAAGADWDDVVEMTTFHVDMARHQDLFRQVREDFITAKPYPAWTAIGVERLWLDELFVEIRVTAYVGNGPASARLGDMDLDRGR